MRPLRLRLRLLHQHQQLPRRLPGRRELLQLAVRQLQRPNSNFTAFAARPMKHTWSVAIVAKNGTTSAASVSSRSKLPSTSTNRSTVSTAKNARSTLKSMAQTEQMVPLSRLVITRSLQLLRRWTQRNQARLTSRRQRPTGEWVAGLKMIQKHKLRTTSNKHQSSNLPMLRKERTIKRRKTKM